MESQKKIGIAWDNSGSITQSQQLVYIQLLKNLLTKFNVIIELKSFHYKLEVSTIYILQNNIQNYYSC